MSTLCMQTVVSGKTVQVVLFPDDKVAKIYIVDDEQGSHAPRTQSVEEYFASGMSEDEIIERVLEVVSTSVEQLDRVRTH
ncbi:hypothetical protein [Burkholderia cenocepacia]|uniref:hypothetical protein n=1 Tax=Burkholderia cenocepacia TaxID=95486 RepID=UPI001F4AB602|nr:hypothetical protein [Burkholderia cenocepacia]HDR9877505.1 hypothetical protein [Burkholderia cenocepacia]HDR9884574.1 hypothetical protein [Burkholderia cenocepacia]